MAKSKKLNVTKIKAAQQSCTPYSAKFINRRVCLSLPTLTTDKCSKKYLLKPHPLPSLTSANPVIVVSKAPEIVFSFATDSVPFARPCKTWTG
ncbi:hypothetical protein BGZ47_003402, partial [Haplosporangium gracile]